MGSALALALVLTLGACSSSTSANLPDTAVYAPAEIGEPHIPGGEPVVPEVLDSTSGPLTLDDLLVFADRHAPAINTARSNVGVADAAIVDARIRAPANPELGLGAGGRTRMGETVAELEASIDQQVEIAGEPGLRVEAAEAEQRYAQAATNEVRWQVHVEVHRIYVALLLAAERRQRAERFVEFSQSLRNVASRQVEAGESSPLILLVAEADLAQTREALISVDQLERALRAELEATIGWPSLTLPEVQGDLPPVRSAPDVSILLERMAEHHPSLRTRELAVAARHAELELERREAWPEPTLGFAWTREGEPGGDPVHGWVFNISFPIPVWRSNQGGQARAEAELRVADAERTENVTRLRSELRQAVIALDAAAARVELYAADVVPQLEQNLALLQRAYELGEVDVHQVSQTRQRLLDATSRYLDARITYFDTATLLEGLVGTELWTVMDANP